MSFASGRTLPEIYDQRSLLVLIAMVAGEEERRKRETGFEPATFSLGS